MKSSANLVVGKLGTGKTTGILMKNVKESIKNGGNIVIFDNKKEYYETFMSKLLEENYDVKVLNLKDSSKTNGWNPLQLPYYFYKLGKIDVAITLLNKLGIEILKNDSMNSDPFWENSAASYFSGMALILFKEGKDNVINIGSILTMINEEEKNIKESIIKKYLEKIESLDPIYITLSTIVYAPNETKGSIIAVLKQNLNLYLMKPNLLNALNKSEIDLTKIEKKTVIFVIGCNDYNKLANVFIDQLVKFVEINNIKYSIVIDDLDMLSCILELENLLQLANEKIINFICAITSLEELEEKYGKYITNKFENIIEKLDIIDFMEIGLYKKYPNLSIEKNQYFDLKDII